MSSINWVRGFVVIGALLAVHTQAVAGDIKPTRVFITGEVQRISLATPADPWSKGIMTVGGINVVIPANLVIQMPVQRYTLQQLFTNATARCVAAVQTGLAKADTCFPARRGAIATVNANRVETGDVIAGEVLLAKSAEFLTGIVTFINFQDGYLRLNGQPNTDTAGVMVRINDPSGRHTLQSGAGCESAATNNCSPDVRFPVDADNYTAVFVTGYPVCLASTKVAGKHMVAAAADGSNDPLCPTTNRTTQPDQQPVPNSTRFAPILVGDSMDAAGNFEDVEGVRFFSAHTVHVHADLTTAPGQADYLIFNETRWDVAGFQLSRNRLDLIGTSTLTTPAFDVYSLPVDPTTNQEHEMLLGSTVGNPVTTNLGIAPAPRGIFRLRYDVDFITGPSARLAPCILLQNAGFSAANGACQSGGTIDIAQNFQVVSPISREVVAHTRNKATASIGPSTDISGNDAPNGQYLSPVGIDQPNFLEINLNKVQTPFIFSGEPWNMDRRLGPNGCIGSCEGSPQPLNPFPYDGLDPRTQSPPGGDIPASVQNRILAFFPFDPTNILTWPPAAPTSQGITPSLPVSLTCTP